MNATPTPTERPKLPDVHPGAYDIIVSQTLLLGRLPMTRQEYEDAVSGLKNLTSYLQGLEAERNRLLVELEQARKQPEVGKKAN